MKRLRNTLSIPLAWLLIVHSSIDSYAQKSRLNSSNEALATSRTGAIPPSPPPLEEAIMLPSLEIAVLAEKFLFDPKAVAAKTESLKRESKAREGAYKVAAKAAEKQVESKERELEKLKSTTNDPETAKNRKIIQCEILKAKKEVTEKTFTFLEDQIAADVQLAKLTLLASWRSISQQLDQSIANGSIGRRPFGNVLDIGNRGTRKPFKGQEDDVRWGEKEINDARQRKLLPREIEDPVITEYVNRVANNIARNSDLQVPLKVYVVQQELRKEGQTVLDKNGEPQQVANAMALPGGYLVIFAGMLLESESESEFAGVVAHEMSHVTARHAQRLANKGKAFSIAQLAALIGLQVFAPGLFYAASYLGYYLKGLLLQAIFNGLGIAFTLDALGVSRDFELEADQLGMQYAWKTGYDPEGFIKVFDHMSQKEGYASHTSFFATHPAFSDRILSALKEYKALKEIDSARFLTDTSEFQEMRKRLDSILRTSEKQIETNANKPSLKAGEVGPEDCPEILSPHPATNAMSTLGSRGSQAVCSLGREKLEDDSLPAIESEKR